jgi:hypothetical protein
MKIDRTWPPYFYLYSKWRYLNKLTYFSNIWCRTTFQGLHFWRQCRSQLEVIAAAMLLLLKKVRETNLGLWPVLWYSVPPFLLFFPLLYFYACLSFVAYFPIEAYQITIVSLPVCGSLLTTFEPISRFYEIQYGDNTIEGDLDAILSNPVASTIPKWRTFKFLRWIQNLHQWTRAMKCCMLTVLQGMNNF